jgi:hypothetical protein
MTRRPGARTGSRRSCACAALREYQVRDGDHIPFHQWIPATRFMAGDFNTGFIDEEYRYLRK